MRIVFCILCNILILRLVSTAQDDPYAIDHYPYINYEINEITDSTGRFSDTLASCLVRLINGNEKFSIAHIGDSHIQADFFTGRVRTRLQMLHPGISGTRGVIFPYELAGTNNPGNYSVKSPNSWEAYRSTKIQECSNIGLYGLKVSTTDTLIELSLRITDTVSEPFNKIGIWYGTDSEGTISVKINGETITDSLSASPNSVATVTLKDYSQQATVTVSLNSPSYFDLFGIELQNDLPGLEYHAIGVNGASAVSYNRSLLFTEQLRRLKPSLIVLSIGTNDAYHYLFSEEWFKNEYSTLIDSISSACPNIPILLSTPNDHLKNRADMSANISVINSVIVSLAKGRGLAYWDFYEIMGGEKSIIAWHSDSLAARDRIHLSPKGYRLKAELFYIALLKAFDKKLSEIDY